jgi:multidrug resistance efflux pump
MSETTTFVPLPARPVFAPPAQGERKWLRRNLKIGAALALLAAGAYATLSGMGYVASDNAVVSAYTVSLRTPIAGYVSGLRAKVGDTVPAGALLGRLMEPRVDDQRLIDLSNQLSRLQSDARTFEAQRADLSRQRDALQERAASRNRAEVDYLSLQAAEAERQLQARTVARDFNRREMDRKATLGRTGDTPAAEIDRTRSAAEQADRDAEAAMARLAYLRIQAEAARNGQMLESGSNDVPYSMQRADEIAIRISEIDREIGRLAAQQNETSARLASERNRVELLRSADLVAPAAGMIWKLGASEGERLAPGDTAAELVDCTSSFIVATIPQDRYSDVQIGSEARVRLSGETKDRIGRVISITGDASLANDRNLAAAPVMPHSAAAIARIEAPASVNAAGSCLVGRTARVLLPTSSGNGMLARLARRLF